MDLVTGAAPKKTKPSKQKALKKMKTEKKGLKRPVQRSNTTPITMRKQEARANYAIPLHQRKVNWYDLMGCTPLFWAISSRNVTEIEFLLSSDADINEPGNVQGDTPLLRAILLGYTEIIGLLIQNGAIIPNNQDHRDYIKCVEEFNSMKRKKLNELLSQQKTKNERLKLDFYYFKEIPRTLIQNWSHIQTLQLRRNNLIELPLIITELQNLTNLDISHNILTSLPKEINKFKELKIFNCSNNFLTKFPKIQDLNQLTTLNLSYNQITSINKVISNLFRLIKFDISHNLIEEIPKFLVEVSGLEFFNVSNNCIYSVGEFSFHLFHALRTLDISNNLISRLPYKILFESNVPSETLRFQCNRFNNIDTQIIKCFYEKSKYLSLSQTGLLEIPPEISFLTRVTYLDLSHNNLVTLSSELSNLIHLTHLDLSYNRITTLPLFFHRFNKLTTLLLDDTKNYIVNPPKSVVDHGLPAIQRYFNDLLEGEPCYRTKLMVVGQGNFFFFFCF